MAPRLDEALAFRPGPAPALRSYLVSDLRPDLDPVLIHDSAVALRPDLAPALRPDIAPALGPDLVPALRSDLAPALTLRQELTLDPRLNLARAVTNRCRSGSETRSGSTLRPYLDPALSKDLDTAIQQNVAPDLRPNLVF